MNQQSQSLSPARSRKCAVYRIVLAAMFACLAFVLNTFVYFPAMAPFQHFVDVIAAVTLGPGTPVPLHLSAEYSGCSPAVRFRLSPGPSLVPFWADCSTGDSTVFGPLPWVK